MLFGILLIIFNSTPVLAANNLVRCDFHLDAKPKIHFITTVDYMGKVQTDGELSGKKFSCSYQIREFNYSPGAVIAHSEFVLKKLKCIGDSTIIERLKQSSSLAVEVNQGKKGFVCGQDLVVNYPLARDQSPFFDGKMVKVSHEKHRKGVWP